MIEDAHRDTYKLFESFFKDTTASFEVDRGSFTYDPDWNDLYTFWLDVKVLYKNILIHYKPYKMTKSGNILEYSVTIDEDDISLYTTVTIDKLDIVLSIIDLIN